MIFNNWGNWTLNATTALLEIKIPGEETGLVSLSSIRDSEDIFNWINIFGKKSYTTKEDILNLTEALYDIFGKEINKKIEPKKILTDKYGITFQ